MNKKHNNHRKQSILAGAMISSVGILLAKMIGLLYTIPFKTIIETNANANYFGLTQQMYSYLLNVSQAGFPFAIATLVAKYSAKQDYQTSLLVKKISNRLMFTFGAIMMLLLMIGSSPLANFVFSGEGNPSDFRWAIFMSSFALFFVPILSSIRGFYQGLKEMELYSISQVLEQLANAGFALGASAIAVYVFDIDRVWAVYLGILATSVAAIAAILFLKYYDKQKMKEIVHLAKQQPMKKSVSNMYIVKELFYVSIPFMITALLGYSDSIINAVILPKGLEAFGYNDHDTTLIQSVVNYSALKLMSIPQVLALGFCSAIIPHISNAKAKKDYRLIRKNILDCIDIVLYIAIPVSFCLYVFAQGLIVTLYPPENVKDIPYAVTILQWFAMLALLNTVAPIITTSLTASGLKKKSVRNVAIEVIVKVGSVYFMIAGFGYIGMVISTFISMMILILLGLYDLGKYHGINFRYTLRKLVVIILGCVVLWGVAQVCFLLGLDSHYKHGKFIALIQLLVAGGLSCLGYFIFTYMCSLPQILFQFDLEKMIKKLKRG